MSLRRELTVSKSLGGVSMSSIKYIMYTEKRIGAPNGAPWRHQLFDLKHTAAVPTVSDGESLFIYVTGAPWLKCHVTLLLCGNDVDHGMYDAL